MSNAYTAPALELNSSLSGFTLISIEEIPEISGKAFVFRHEMSGARALWLACADSNRSFAIAFKTPPQDNTGVFHILEHSVLCGSKRYPVKEPFVHLLKSSMQTFLNALTFPDKTMYPVASTNIADLENLMSVYLDAVLHPNIYTRKHIFEQEGWHFELDEQTGILSYNGVVFNEMKGAMSDPDDVVFHKLMTALFPDNAYGFDSGGHPRAIPTLSYEAFLDSHARHYNLANSYTIFYGDLDIERELAFVAERFEHARPQTHEAPNPLVAQKPHMPSLTRFEMATAPENASVGLAYVVGTALEREKLLATEILFDALCGSNEAPLKRKILEAQLADELEVTLNDSCLQPQLILSLKGSKPNVAESFRALVEQEAANFVSKGLPHDRLRASLAAAEFNLREGDFGPYADGVALSMRVMGSWLYDDDHATDALRYEQALANIKAALDEGYFEALLDELICKSTHNACVELVPTETGDAQEELDELAAKKAAMSPQELERIMSDVAELRAEQDREESEEDLATLPHLQIKDIEEPAPEVQPRSFDAPLPCRFHELETHKIAYVYHYFDLRRLEMSDLAYTQLLCSLLGKLDTLNYSAAELDMLQEEKLGSLNFFTETYGRDDDDSFVQPLLVVGASALSENIDALASLPQEIWANTRFDDKERIFAIVQQQRVALEQGFLNAGHSSALAYLSSLLRRSSRASAEMSGVRYYSFVKGLLKDWDSNFDALVLKLQELVKTIFTSDEVLVSFTGSESDCKAFWDEAQHLGLEPYPQTITHKLAVELDSPQNVAFTTPSNVVFVGAAAPRSARDTGSLGLWNVATRALSYDYLWNEVRVKGGAYGVGFRHPSTYLREFYSYRDPSVDATFARYAQSANWLQKWNPSADEFTGYVVSTVASHDAPLKPRALARRQDGEYFSQRKGGWRDEIRAQELAASVSNIQALAKALEDFEDESFVCVFGSKDLIEASELTFEITELMG